MRQRDGEGKPSSTSSGKNAQRQRDQQTPPAHNGGGKRPSRPRTASVDSCSELASVKRGTISCPNASEKKSTQGTRANIFSTQIGYSNYPRLFNLATRLRALFQVPSTIAEIGEFGVGEGLAIFPAVTSFHACRKKKRKKKKKNAAAPTAAAGTLFFFWVIKGKVSK